LTQQELKSLAKGCLDGALEGIKITAESAAA
jgi:hypothetical protein